MKKERKRGKNPDIFPDAALDEDSSKEFGTFSRFPNLRVAGPHVDRKTYGTVITLCLHDIIRLLIRIARGSLVVKGKHVPPSF